MFKREFVELWRTVTGDSHFAKEYWKDWRHTLSTISPELANTTYMKHYKEARMNCSQTGSLAPLQPATCTGWMNQYYINDPFPVQTCPEMYGVQEGNNPMNTSYAYPKAASGDMIIQLAPAASASVNTKSDTAIQRDYLMGQFKNISREFGYGNKHSELRRLFNLDVNNAPKTTRELIDMIKTGKFTLDDRKADLQDKGNEYDEADDEYIAGPFGALEWAGPTPDRAGFDAAKETIGKLLVDTERTIIVKSPDEGLAAIQALEAWTPTGKPN